MRLMASLICGPKSVETLAALRDLGIAPTLLVTHAQHLPQAAALLPELPATRLLARETLRRARDPGYRNPPVGDAVASSSRFLLTALAILDRVNWNGANLSDMFRLYLRYWSAWIDTVAEVEPEICWFDGVPHQAQDWALYHVCKDRGIPTVVSCATVFDNSPAIYHDIADEPIRVDRLLSDLDIARRQPTSNYLDKTVGRLTDQSTLRSERGLAELGSGGFRRVLRILAGALKTVPSNYPLLIPSWERRVLSRTVLRMRDRVRIARQARLLLSMPQRPTARKPYVLFPLHFQPELTSVPLGIAHFDQISAIRALASGLNGESHVVVKEHPQMLRWSSGWSRARSRAFYDELIAIPGVELVSPAAPTEELIKSSLAVATLTGTVGYEARLLGVPALCFGAPWYQPLRGVYRLRQPSDLKLALSEVLTVDGSAPLTGEEVEAFVASYTLTGAWGRTTEAHQARYYPKLYAAQLLAILDSARRCGNTNGSHEANRRKRGGEHSERREQPLTR